MDPFDYQTTATYDCANGYGLVGGNKVRQCVASSLGSGEWDGTAPLCQGSYEVQYHTALM